MNKKRDVLDITRELGNAITESEEYKSLLKAEEDFYNDLELNKKLNDLEVLKNKSQLNKNDSEKSDDEIDDLENNNKKIISLEESVSDSITIKNLGEAKEKYDKLFKNINNLISYMTDDESRIKLTQSKSGCGGCSGCSKK